MWKMYDYMSSTNFIFFIWLLYVERKPYETPNGSKEKNLPIKKEKPKHVIFALQSAREGDLKHM